MYGEIYFWNWWLGLLYWRNFTSDNAGRYQPKHHISLKPQTARRTMRSVNRNS